MKMHCEGVPAVVAPWHAPCEDDSQSTSVALEMRHVPRTAPVESSANKMGSLPESLTVKMIPGCDGVMVADELSTRSLRPRTATVSTPLGIAPSESACTEMASRAAGWHDATRQIADSSTPCDARNATECITRRWPYLALRLSCATCRGRSCFASHASPLIHGTQAFVFETHNWKPRFHTRALEPRHNGIEQLFRNRTKKFGPPACGQTIGHAKSHFCRNHGIGHLMHSRFVKFRIEI